jgi:hypothetical protein
VKAREHDDNVSRRRRDVSRWLRRRLAVVAAEKFRDEGKTRGHDPVAVSAGLSI